MVSRGLRGIGCDSNSNDLGACRSSQSEATPWTVGGEVAWSAAAGAPPPRWTLGAARDNGATKVGMIAATEFQVNALNTVSSCSGQRN